MSAYDTFGEFFGRCFRLCFRSLPTRSPCGLSVSKLQLIVVVKTPRHITLMSL
jgi:hypothetical protein